MDLPAVVRTIKQFECWRMLGDSQSEVAGRVFCTSFAGS
jgi:hypothetical protein